PIPEDPPDAVAAAVRAAGCDAVRPLAEGGPERAVVVLRRGAPVAWAGPLRVRPDSLPTAGGVQATPLWVVLHAHAAEGRDRAIATILVHAAQPADSLADPLDRKVARALGVRAFEFAPEAEVAAVAAARVEAGLAPLAGDSAWHPVGGAGSGVRARVLLPSEAEARLRAVEEARRRGAAALLARAL
ncbi:hypothetical protein, partial [Roseisolibacter sp. H3M3-2]|uniref:hypothetical protein n=1 Tax=Roseisolibacter sp. H3M3-2 TaxID=3031323 RepID=UPI0023DB49B9